MELKIYDSTATNGQQGIEQVDRERENPNGCESEP